MISALTEEGAEATLEAMDLGAIDFVVKPGATVSLEIDRLGPLLVQKVRAAANAHVHRALRLTERIRHRLRGAAVSRGPDRSPRKSPAKTKAEPASGLVLIGTSTGGPAALDVVLPRLPPDFPWPVMVAQHMPASFTGPFAQRLDRRCDLRVVEVSKPTPLVAGTIYIGRGDADLIVATRSTGMIAMPVPGRRDYLWHPSVERMVTSALEQYEATQLVGVMMTGMGRDGAAAMTRLRKQGGRTIAEAESTAVVWGMPGELVRDGGAELVRPVEDIAATVIEWVAASALR